MPKRTRSLGPIARIRSVHNTVILFRYIVFFFSLLCCSSNVLITTTFTIVAIFVCWMLHTLQHHQLQSANTHTHTLSLGGGDADVHHCISNSISVGTHAAVAAAALARPGVARPARCPGCMQFECARTCNTRRTPRHATPQQAESTNTNGWKSSMHAPAQLTINMHTQEFCFNW